jgi:hypothetical protein
MCGATVTAEKEMSGSWRHRFQLPIWNRLVSGIGTLLTLMQGVGALKRNVLSKRDIIV